jgi:hypothetical protein
VPRKPLYLQTETYLAPPVPTEVDLLKGSSIVLCHQLMHKSATGVILIQSAGSRSVEADHCNIQDDMLQLSFSSRSRHTGLYIE